MVNEIKLKFRYFAIYTEYYFYSSYWTLVKRKPVLKIQPVHLMFSMCWYTSTVNQQVCLLGSRELLLLRLERQHHSIDGYGSCVCAYRYKMVLYTN